jgi:hypothetical protein
VSTPVACEPIHQATLARIEMMAESLQRGAY